MMRLYDKIFADKTVIVSAKQKKAIFQAFTKLPEDQRNVLKLYYEKQLSIKEIALQLNYSTTTIYHKHYRALHTLKLKFNPGAFSKINQILYGHP